MTVNKIKLKIMELLNNNIELKTFVVKNKLKLHEIPIIVYCYSKKCDAGHQLALNYIELVLAM